MSCKQKHYPLPLSLSLSLQFALISLQEKIIFHLKFIDVIQPVAFTASLTKDTSIGILQTIIYDHVITNVGNTYDPRHGIFRAPVKGLYHMSLTSISMVDNAIFLEMVKDGQRLIHSYSGSRDYHSSSASVNVVLEAGSDIWCRHYRDSNAVIINAQDSGTCFSGFLLNRIV